MKNLCCKSLILLVVLLSGSFYNSQEIPYQLANNYFVNNTYAAQEPHVLKITTEQKFNEVFGMATTMGSEGKPTPINFIKSFVIAIIDSENNSTTGILIKSLTKESKTLNLRYAILKKKMFQILPILDSQKS